MRVNRNLWPAILVALGVLVLLQVLSDGNTPPGVILVVVGASLLGVTLLTRFGRPRMTNRAPHTSIPHKGAERVRLRIHGMPGPLQIGPGASSTDLATGQCPGGTRYLRGTDGDIHTIDLTSLARYIPGWAMRSAQRPPAWVLHLNETTVYGLALHLTGPWANVDLTPLLVSRLDVTAVRCNLSVRLPQFSGLTRVRIGGTATKVHLHVPAGVAARVTVRKTKAAIQVNRSRFPLQGKGYASPNFASAPNRAEILIDVANGQVEIT